jgi:hypothetical protein
LEKPVTDPRDEIDSWLDREVDLLPSPPGTFTAVRVRARRRKRNQALLTTAAAVVVVGVAVTVPTVLHSALSSGPAQPAASSHTRTITEGPSSSPAKTTRPSPRASSGNTGGQRSTLVNSTTGPPANFRPTSMTFVASGSRLLGAAVGQAGPPCAGGPICTSMASTYDYGASWHGFSAPRAPSAAKPGGVSQVRFITPEVGWAFGPGLYATADSGATWTQQRVPGGGRVIDLEGTGNGALALVGSCTGTGSNYAASCSSFSLYSYNAAAPGQGWQRVSLPDTMTAGGQPTAARLVVAATTGFVLAPDGKVLEGQLDGQGWKVRTIAPCTPGAPSASGQPSGGLLASGTDAGADDLFEYCAGGSASQGTISAFTLPGGHISYSQLRHPHWTSFGTVQLGGGQPTSLAGARNVTVLATTQGIFYASPSGRWHAASVAVPPPGGFTYIGMTNSSQGVAIPADVRLSEIFTTGDGGRTWQADHIG